MVDKLDALFLLLGPNWLKMILSPFYEFKLT